MFIIIFLDFFSVLGREIWLDFNGQKRDGGMNIMKSLSNYSDPTTQLDTLAQ